MNNVSKLIKTAVIIMVIVLPFGFLFRSKDYGGRITAFDTAILELLGRNGIEEKDLLYEKREKYKSGRHFLLRISRHYDVGSGFDPDDLTAQLEVLCGKTGIRIAGSALETAEGRESFLFSFSMNNRIVYDLKFLKRGRAVSILPKAKTGKIAVILDDFGYNTNNLAALFEINSPMTVSILPNLPYSAYIAKEAAARNLEVMLHLPMEPHGGSTNLEKGTIMADMQPEQTKGILVRAIDSVPGARGVSNHMGSRATEDKPLMKIIFNELRKRGLYFIDSLVTDKSVCREAAGEVKLRIAVRNVFLDNEPDEDYIKGQISLAADLAAKTGWAIAVGHDRPQTIRALAKAVPRLQKDGFKFVYVSELVN